MGDKVFAVDGAWYLHRIFHTTPNATEHSGAYIAKRFLALICKDALAVRAKRVLVAFDGDAVFRYKISDVYKANRDKNKDGDVDLIHNKEGLVDGPYIYLPEVMSLLAYAGIPCVQKARYEGDDILASIAHQYNDVVLGNKDKDQYQSVREGVVLYDSSFTVKQGGKKVPKPRTTTYRDVEKLFGIEPRLCVALQTLTGDAIDNIPVIVSRAKAIKGLKQYGGIKAWVDADPAIRKLLSANMAQLKINKKLVTLVTDIKVDIPPVKWNPGSDLPLTYIQYREWMNPKSKGLF